MMGVNELAQYLAGQTQETFYPLRFSLNSPNHASIINFSGGLPSRAGVARISVQIVTRADHPETAEQSALKIKKFLDHKANFDVGSTHVILSFAENPVPLYIGQDNNQRHQFSMNYMFILEV